MEKIIDIDKISSILTDFNGCENLTLIGKNLLKLMNALNVKNIEDIKKFISDN